MMTTKLKTTNPEPAIGLDIYLKHAGVASRIFAKAATSPSRGALMQSGASTGGNSINSQIKPVTPMLTTTPDAQADATPAAPKGPKPVEPIPANVPPPPAPPPAPQSGLPPATPMPAAPSGQANGQPPAAPVPQTQEQNPIPPENRTTTDGQPLNPPPGQTSGQTPAPNTDPFASIKTVIDDPQLPKEQKVAQIRSTFQEYVKANPDAKADYDAFVSGNDPEAAKRFESRVNAGGKQYIDENVRQMMRQNPNASVQDQGSFFAKATQMWEGLPQEAKYAIGIGLPVALLGGVMALAGGDGMGMPGGIMALLGLGAAGLGAANAGVFGNDARMMLGQGALGLGRMAGMNIPDTSALGPEGMAQAQQGVRDAMMKKDDKGNLGGWTAGQAKIDEFKKPLDTLHAMGRDTGTTALMGWMKTNDPQAAAAKYDELMRQRQEISHPDYLYNQVVNSKENWLGSLGPYMRFGSYPQRQQ